MYSKIINSALVVIVLSMVAVAHAADVSTTLYCMGNLCIGDPIAKHRERFNIAKENIETLKNPACDILLPFSYSHVEGDTEFKITVWPNPAKAGLDNGEYYEVTGISVITPLADESAVQNKGRELASRFKLKATRRTSAWQSGDGRIALQVETVAMRIPAASAFILAKTPWTGAQYAQQKGCRAALPKF